MPIPHANPTISVQGTAILPTVRTVPAAQSTVTAAQPNETAMAAAIWHAFPHVALFQPGGRPWRVAPRGSRRHKPAA